MTARKSLCAFILAAALPVSVPVCSWAGKASYAVPPSPYGQVGNPYLTPVPLPHFPTPPIQAPVVPVVPPVPQPVAPKPVAIVRAPKPVPAPAPAAVATIPPPPAANDGYQVPATSKYAARINAARAASSAASSAAAEAPASAPATDHVFVPGEHYTDASEAPRQYSLHRQWGLTPDKITTDHTATGALLTLSDVPGSGKSDAGPTDKDTPDDDGAEAPNTTQTATP